MAWPEPSITVPRTCQALLEHWASVGLPGYAQFDNDGRFAGSSSTAEAIGPVIRTCLSVGVTPIFAPPREHGFQAAIESFNGRWQAKLGMRWQDGPLGVLQQRSDEYTGAARRRGAVRIDAAPPRRPLRPEPASRDLADRRRIIYLRRTDELGWVTVLGRSFHVDRAWTHRLVRAEVDLGLGAITFFALRRREPTDQPLLRQIPWQPPRRWRL